MGRKLVGRAALLLGSGALSAAASHADVPKAGIDTAAPRAPEVRPGDVFLELREGKLFLIEPGQAAEELVTDAQPNGELLRRLVESAGGRGPVRVSPLVVADGAGGVQWVRPKQSGGAAKPAATEKAPTDGATKASSDSNAKEEKKAE
jgi:hypothetical protein